VKKNAIGGILRRGGLEAPFAPVGGGGSERASPGTTARRDRPLSAATRCTELKGLGGRPSFGSLRELSV